MSPAESRYNALVIMVAFLQRLMVFQNATSHVTQTPTDPAVLQDLIGKLQVLNDVVKRSDEAKDVSPADTEAVRPIAQFLATEIRAYYDTDLSGPLRTQAPFGAAAVFSASFLTQGTVRMGEVFDHPEWADRARQHLPQLLLLRNQANTAVASAAQGEPSEDAARFIREHVGVAQAERDLVLAQVDGLDQLLDGQRPGSA